ncbi:hypothetical protein [Listeria fleischmannii]|uniref:hypothetical protein n=1 Tax=Listeria fleischmannii TaxID=1069827 RepID=UPI000254F9CD|nr:hypothetical protein [Listeria fleischmannii]EIA21409.1 hypothetical protein KKC_01427 [Listeria fleischmannii subsp. coloradonensis]MBC1420094.1 hypothetical protein [Listeria fleischmannii]STY35267.1 Uncharacterised protein [Listeria fleischmannii subsp. coloradonensis]
MKFKKGKAITAPPYFPYVEPNIKRIDTSKHDVIIAHDSTSKLPIIYVDNKQIENIEFVEFKWVTADDSNESELYLHVSCLTEKMLWADNSPRYVTDGTIERREIIKGDNEIYELQKDEIIESNMIEEGMNWD